MLFKAFIFSVIFSLVKNANGDNKVPHSNPLENLMLKRCLIALQTGTLDYEKTFLCKALVKTIIRERSANQPITDDPNLEDPSSEVKCLITKPFLNQVLG